MAGIQDFPSFRLFFIPGLKRQVCSTIPPSFNGRDESMSF